jgi:hypothetical protein
VVRQARARQPRPARPLVGYRLNIRARDKDELAGRPKRASQWDGVAELWDRDEAALDAAHSGSEARESRETRLRTSRGSSG